MTENETPIRIYWQLPDFTVKCCGHKYCVSMGEKIKGRWWKFRPDRHVAATHNLKYAKN